MAPEKTHIGIVLLRRVFAALLLAAGLVLAGVAAVVGLINIAPVREAVLEAALAAARTGDTEIEIGGIDGVWPGTLRLSDLSIGDAAGTWATLASAEIDWRPLALWRGTLHVTRLDIEGLRLLRVPEGDAEDDADIDIFVLPEIPVLPLALDLEAFTLRDMLLGEALTGEEIAFDAAGHALYTFGRTDIAIEAVRRGEVQGRIEAALRYHAGPERGTFNLTLTDGAAGQRGIVARLAGLDGADAVTAEAEGQSLVGLMTGALKIDAGRALRLDGDMHGAFGERVNLNLRLAAQGTTVARELSFLGAPEQARVSGRLTQSGRDVYRIEDAALEAGTIKVNGAATATRGAADYAVEAAGTAAGLEPLLEISGTETLGTAGWRLSGRIGKAGDAAIIDEAALTALGGEAKFTGTARIDMGSGATHIAGDVEAAISDLAPLGRAIGQPMRGTAEATLTSLQFGDGTGSGEIALRTGPIETGDAGLDRLLAGGVTATAGAGFNDAGALSIADLDAAAGGLKLDGRFSMTAGGEIDGAASLTVAEIADLAGEDLRGALAASATLGGRRDAASLTLTAELNDGAAGGIDIARGVLDATLVQGGTGTAALRLDGADGRATIATPVTLPAEGGARFEKIEASIFGATLTGAVALSPDWIADGQISGRRIALEPLGRLAGIALAGRGDIALTLGDVRGRQDARATLSARRVAIELDEVLTLDGVAVEAALSDIGGAATLDARLVAEGGAAGNTQFNEISASARGPLDNVALAVSLTGERLSLRSEPVALSFDGAWRGERLALDRLSASIGETGLTLAEPTAIALPEGGIVIERLALAFTSPAGPGALTMALTQGPRAARVSFEADAFPLALLTPLLPLDAAGGSMSGTATLDTAREQGEVALRFTDVRLSDADLDMQPAFGATLDGRWAQKRLTVKALAHGVSEEPFVLNASLPLVRDPGGAWPVLPARGAVEGDLNWRGPMASLMALADLPGQRLAGDATVALAASGDISAPVFSGTARLTNGVFENFATGTLFRDLDMRIEGERSEVLRFTLDARDGGGGRLTSEGTLTLAATAAQAVAVRARLSDMQIVRRQDLTLSATGDLVLAGAALPPREDAPLKLSGALTATDALFVIPERLPGSVPHIAVIEVNEPDGAAAARPVEDAAPFPAELDLAFAIVNPPAQVTGRGVDALWTGELKVTGPAENPRVTGTLRSLRGTLEFAGKTFTLSRGLVTFRGETPPDPDIDIALDYTRGDFKATVAVGGRGSSPAVTLRSQPPMPQDEIISRILFEKRVGELSALEAAQLANTAAELSGAGGIGGFGLLGQMQRSLGLDVLRVDQGASGGTTVAAGKYLREGFYVGVEQGALASDSSVKIEIDLTDNISVDTKVGQDATGDVGINWKWDY
ncbi:translocation/assembly module TamB [Parvibaculum sp.]|uniref:translocation/assembly module TamB domain-containing protein n=1 Tax=Parvibaculum sp. TaxID=2024848 RepID=UPI002620DFBB|nr:translocation/assembly module TamB [Parvibaculum sp.]MCW5725846.1 translocation/assembly module TamB domain-containing protein [Parvibaculum sp.]